MLSLVQTNNNNNSVTMSSRDIAELTGKNHADVMRDIRKMLESLSKDESIFAGIYFDAYNREKPCYNLPRRECEILITGYDVVRRAKIIDRWHDLETGAAKPQVQRSDNMQLALVESFISTMNLQGSAALGVYKNVQKAYGLPDVLPAYGIDAPANDHQGSYQTKALTVLLADYRVGMSTQKCNSLLEKLGMLETVERQSTGKLTKKYKRITKKGLAYGKNVTSAQNQRETAPHWYAETFKELLSMVLDIA